MSIFPVGSVSSRHKVGATSSKEHVLEVTADFPSPPNPPHILHLNLWKLQLYKAPTFLKLQLLFKFVQTSGTIMSFRHTNVSSQVSGSRTEAFHTPTHLQITATHLSCRSAPPPVLTQLPLSEMKLFTGKIAKTRPEFLTDIFQWFQSIPLSTHLASPPKSLE